MTLPTLTIGSTDQTDFVQDKTLNVKQATLDAVLVNPSTAVNLGDSVTCANPTWSGTVTTVEPSSYQHGNGALTRFVKITATNTTPASATSAPWGISDTPNNSTTFPWAENTLIFNDTRNDKGDQLRGTFSIYKAGLAPGQTIPITSTADGYSAENFLITEVNVSWRNPTAPKWDVTVGHGSPAPQPVTLRSILQRKVTVPIAPDKCTDWTATGFFPPLNGTTSDATGNLIYYRPGLGSEPIVPTPGFVGGFAFPAYGASGGIDEAGDCTLSSVRCIVGGNGRISIPTFDSILGGSGAHHWQASLNHHDAVLGPVVDATLTGAYGSPVEFNITGASVSGYCYSWVDILDDSTSCGGKVGYQGFHWTQAQDPGDVTARDVVVGIQTIPVDNTTPTDGEVLAYNGVTGKWSPTPSASSLPPTGTAGGDLSSTYPNPTVAKINGSPLGTISAPGLADRLRWNGSAWVNSPLIWRPVMAFDPTSGNYLPVTTGGGDAVLAEA